MDVNPSTDDQQQLPEGLFFTLPSELLENLRIRLGPERFGAGAWQEEQLLSKRRTLSNTVGFWRQQQISYDLLRPNEWQVSPEDGVRFGWTDDQIKAVNTLGASRTERFAYVSRAYAGWLMTNAAFLGEQQELLTKWGGELVQYGIPQMGPVVRDARNFPTAVAAQPGRLDDFVQGFESFFVRWRLQGMAAPFLPRPLPPQMPVSVLKDILGHMRLGGQTFYLPDTYPVPSRDELREIMEDALRGREAPQHLAEWMQIVHSSNPARTPLKRFARLLGVQHYWRAIFDRHGDALRRARGAVAEALATFFGTSEDTIRDDLAVISSRLGDDWSTPGD